MNELHAENACFHHITGLMGDQLYLVGKTMLLQLIFDKTDGQACRIDRHVEFFEQVRQAADVVLMPVGDKQTLDAVLVFQHIGKIGDDQIDAEHIGVGEHKPAVH